MWLIKVVFMGLLLVLLSACVGDRANVKQKIIQKKEYKKVQNIATNPYKIKKSQKLIAVTNYLIKKELIVEKPSFPNKPEKPSLPLAKELKKGKYEKTKDFEARVERERKKRAKEIKAIENSYAKEVSSYNKKMKELTDGYNNALAKKQKNIQKITQKAMQEAYAVVYGKPYLDKELKYDADSETFYGRIKATKGGFDESVAIKVPVDKAEKFEKNVKSLQTKVIFDYSHNTLSMKKIIVGNHKKEYVAMMGANSFKSKNIVVKVDGGSFNLAASPLLSSALDVSENDYRLGHINYSKDPEIAKLQKKRFALEQKVRYKNDSRAKKAQLKKQKEALEAQIALLEQKSGGVDDIKILLKKSASRKIDPHKWLFIVAIENYDFTDPVAYSKNSAEDFKAVAQKRLGISQKQTRTLINKGATSGKIRYYMQDMLAHVKSGDTIYFYYSGHGVPVASQDNAPYMLAQDMSPDYVANDEKFKLQNIYQSLSHSKASKVVAFVDSCFSGGADNVALFKGVAATRIKPKKVSFDKTKMLVITAGSGTQYSNKYDEKSNRLFSYFVMRGLIKNNSNPQRLYDYVKSNVQDKSYEMGASYEQVPVFDGNIKLEL